MNGPDDEVFSDEDLNNLNAPSEPTYYRELDFNVDDIDLSDAPEGFLDDDYLDGEV